MSDEEESIRLSENFEATGIEFYKLAKQMGMEGIMAKKADSPYQPGVRNTDWLKIKIARRQEVVIGGYTNNADSNKPFSALLVSVARLREKGDIFKPMLGKGIDLEKIIKEQDLA